MNSLWMWSITNDDRRAWGWRCSTPYMWMEDVELSERDAYLRGNMRRYRTNPNLIVTGQEKK